ncbi:neurogenic locus notch-like, partial [Tropilaelaps mercedesae]
RKKAQFELDWGAGWPTRSDHTRHLRDPTEWVTVKQQQLLIDAHNHEINHINNMRNQFGNTNVSMLCLPRVQAPQAKLKSHPAEVLPLRKFSVELPMPKILITANVSSCESEADSPPRSPSLTSGVPGGYPMDRCQLGATGPVGGSGGAVKMCYLSPFMGAPGTADSRTISESNLSTSGYSSISSPGLSRCNSSSPMIADEIVVGAFQRAGQGHLQASPTRAGRKASHQLVATFSSNYPPTSNSSSSASSANTSAREQHHVRQQHNNNRERDEGMCTTPLVPTARPGGPFGQYLLEPDGQESTRRRSSFGGCFASHEGPGGNSRHHDSVMAGHCGAAGLPPSHPNSRCPSRLLDSIVCKDRVVVGYTIRGAGYGKISCPFIMVCSGLNETRPRCHKSRCRYHQYMQPHSYHPEVIQADVFLCVFQRTTFQLEKPHGSFSHHGPDQEREIREVLLQRARCKTWQPLQGGQPGTGCPEQNYSSSGSGNVSRSPSHLEPTALATLGQELTGGLSSPSSTASMESVVPSKICRNASKSSVGGTSVSGLPGNVTTSESDSERKHAAQVQAQRAARRLQKKQRSMDAGGVTASAAGGGSSSGQLQVDRQKLSPGLRPQRSRSPCLSPWSSVDRPGHSPRGSTQDLGGKMFICSSSSSDEEPTIDYAMNYVESANRPSRGTARLMRSATVETCDCSQKPRRQRSRCSQESQSPHAQAPSSSSRNLLTQPTTLSCQKSASFDGGCGDYAPPGSESSTHGSPSRSSVTGTFRGLSRDASSNSGSWGSHHSLRRQCALQDNAADEM